MCGIIGVVSRGWSDQRVNLTAALDTIAHRGLKPYREVIARNCFVTPEVADSIIVKD